MPTNIPYIIYIYISIYTHTTWCCSPVPVVVQKKSTPCWSSLRLIVSPAPKSLKRPGSPDGYWFTRMQDFTGYGDLYGDSCSNWYMCIDVYTYNIYICIYIYYIYTHIYTGMILLGKQPFKLLDSFNGTCSAETMFLIPK
mgnify:CR=1 FL=1